MELDKVMAVGMFKIGFLLPSWNKDPDFATCLKCHVHLKKEQLAASVSDLSEILISSTEKACYKNLKLTAFLPLSGSQNRTEHETLKLEEKRTDNLVPSYFLP